MPRKRGCRQKSFGKPQISLVNETGNAYILVTEDGDQTMFTQRYLSVLRTEYAKINTIDPSKSSYRRLIQLLDALSPKQLEQLRDADIKFMSKLANNRILRNAK